MGYAHLSPSLNLQIQGKVLINKSIIMNELGIKHAAMSAPFRQGWVFTMMSSSDNLLTLDLVFTHSVAVAGTTIKINISILILIIF
jgi:hypothetical protein